MLSHSFVAICSLLLNSSVSSLNLPARANPIAAPNPLPPPPPRPPIGPQNYPIPGTSLRLNVQRPYGQDLPGDATLFCLMSAQSALDRQIAAGDDRRFPGEWEFEEVGINIEVISIFRAKVYTSTVVDALRGMLGVMVEYPEVGARAVKAILTLESETHGVEILGRIEVSNGGPRRGDGTLDALNSTMSGLNTTPLTALDPSNYHIPNTDITIALQKSQEDPPYGPALPLSPVIIALASAFGKVGTEMEDGDHAITSQWDCRAGDVGIDAYPLPHPGSKLSVLQVAFLGLADLMQEPGGVGAVAADFEIRQQGKGLLFYGKLIDLRETGGAVEGVATS